MDDFYPARSRFVPPLPGTIFAPPFMPFSWIISQML
ncbi:hypothetical protein ABIE69_001255 [Rhodobacteraceae bacterium MBR-64]